MLGRSHIFRVGKYTPLGVIMPAMITAFKFGDFGFVCCSSHETPGQHGRLGSRIADHCQFCTGYAINESFGEFHFSGVGCSIAHTQLTLFVQCLQYWLRSVAKHMHPKGHCAINIAVTVDIPDIGSLGALYINRIRLHFACSANKPAGNQVPGFLPE